MEPVEEVVEGADSWPFLVGVEAAEQAKDAAGRQVGDPGVERGLAHEDGEEDEAEHDHRVPGSTPTRAGCVARLEDGAGGLEVELGEGEGGVLVAMELLDDVRLFGVSVEPGADEGEMGYVSWGGHRVHLVSTLRITRLGAGCPPPPPSSQNDCR